jgi:hypothetical protein
MPHRLVLTALLAIFLSAQFASRSFAEKAQPVTDPAKADADFAFQGEYVGEMKAATGPKKFGVQVIALGDGKFHAVAYKDGLPGEGGVRNEKNDGDGELKDGALVLSSKQGEFGTIKNGVLSVSGPNGTTLGEFKKVERQSPTIGAKPPEGAIILFDGKSGDKFNGGKGKVEDGLLVPRADSDLKYQNCTLHVEFRLPYMPHDRGQARANSGVYLQGRYETQVLDSFGLKGENNECGAIYELHAPLVNMCYPPLAWQTYDIDFTAAKYDAAGKKTENARITVKHNGVLVQDNVEITRATRASPVMEGPEPGPLHLQDHGNPVRFRNIWIVEKK